MLAPLLPCLPDHAPAIRPLTPIEKSVILSVATGDTDAAHKRFGYYPSEIHTYGKSIHAKLGASSVRWAELVYRAVLHREVPAYLPPRTEVWPGEWAPWVLSGLAAGKRPRQLCSVLGVDERQWSLLAAQVLNATGARSIPHAVYLSARLISWPWTSSGEWDAPQPVPLPPR